MSQMLESGSSFSQQDLTSPEDDEVDAIFQPGERDSGNPSVSDSETSSVPITCLERLIRTHPIWFLPTVSREEAGKTLLGKEEGNFVVRQSSQARTMALTMRLGPDQGVDCQHYLIIHNNNNKMALENSDLEFDNILSLIYHYFNVCEELPMKLALPEILRDTEARQSLASLALLGKDFWHYPMANPGRRPLTHIDLDSAISSSSPASNLSYADIDTPEDTEDRQEAMQRQGVLDHRTTLMLAQSKLLDARWPVGPMEGSIAIPSMLGGSLYTTNNMTGITYHAVMDNISMKKTSICDSETINSPSSPSSPHTSRSPSFHPQPSLTSVPPLPPPRSSSRQSTASPKGSPARSRRRSDSNCTLLTPTVSPRVSRHSVCRMQMLQEDSARGLGKSPPFISPNWSKSPLHEVNRTTPEEEDATSRNNIEGGKPNVPGFAARHRKASVFGESEGLREGDKEGDRFPVKLDLQVPLTQPHNLVSSVLKTQFNKKIHGVKSGGSPITHYYRSSIADKMSDYEDIWDQTPPRETAPSFPGDQEGSVSPVTPAQSEQQFKNYLLQKFNERQGSPSEVSEDEGVLEKSNSSNHSSLKSGSSCCNDTEDAMLSSLSDSDCLSTSVSSSISSSSANISHTSPDVSSSSLSTDSAPMYTRSPNHDQSQDDMAMLCHQSSNYPDKDLNPFYSDPLDALEEAKDTVYNTPDSDSNEGEKLWRSKEDVSVLQQRHNIRRNRFSDSNIRYVQETRKTSMLQRIESVEVMKSCEMTKSSSLTNIATTELSFDSPPVLRKKSLLRKYSTKSQKSPSRSRKNSKRENRLSAVIGKYIKPPKVGNKSLGMSWQVDSSSWEFLAHEAEDDADVSSEGEDDKKKPVKRKDSVKEVKQEVKSQSWSKGERKQSLLQARQSPYENNIEGNKSHTDLATFISDSSDCSDLIGHSDLVSESMTPPSISKDSSNGCRSSKIYQSDSLSEKQNLECPKEDLECHQSSLNSNKEGSYSSNSQGSEKQDTDKSISAKETKDPDTSKSSRDSVYESEYDPTGNSSLESSSKSPSGLTVSLPKQIILDPPSHKFEADLMSRSTDMKEDFVGVPSMSWAKKQPSESSLVIQECVLQLSKDRTTIFGQNIFHFVQCTLESKEKDPVIVMRNMRQFMSGIKNYLVKSGEGDLHVLLDNERGKLRQDEFLNIDSILEEVMHKLVILPLKKHLSQLFAEDFHKSGCLQLLSENMNFALSKSKEEFNIPLEFIPNLRNTIDFMRQCFAKMKETFSPVEKLGHLLTTIKYILNSSSSPCKLSVSSFCSLLGYLMVQSGMEWVEVESEYMWGLLHPALLSGEGGYYLTILSSTIHFLKNIKECFMEDGDISEIGEKQERSSLSSPRLASLDGTIHVIIPDETNGSIVNKSLPLKPSMTVREVSKIIAHKLKITNPEDFCLYSLVDGNENLLTDSLRPGKVKADSKIQGKTCTFVYKRQDSNIAWPIRQTTISSTQSFRSQSSIQKPS